MKNKVDTSIYAYANIMQLTPKEIIILQANDELESKYFSKYIENLKNAAEGKGRLEERAEVLKVYLFYLIVNTKSLFENYDEIYVDYTLYIYKLALDAFMDDFEQANPLNKKTPYLRDVYKHKMIMTALREKNVPKKRKFQDANSNIHQLNKFYDKIAYRQDDIKNKAKEFDLYFDFLNNSLADRQRTIYRRMVRDNDMGDFSVAFICGNNKGYSTAHFTGFRPHRFIRVYLTQEQSYFDYFNRRELSNVDYKTVPTAMTALKNEKNYNFVYKDNSIDFVKQAKKIKFKSFAEYIEENFKNVKKDEIQNITKYIEKERVPYRVVVKQVKEGIEEEYQSGDASFFRYMHTIGRNNLYTKFISNKCGEGLSRDDFGREMAKLSDTSFTLMSLAEIVLDMVSDLQNGKYDDDNLMFLYNLTSLVKMTVDSLYCIENREVLLYFQYAVYILKTYSKVCYEMIKEVVDNEQGINKELYRYLAQIEAIMNFTALNKRKGLLDEFFEENSERIFKDFREYLIDDDFDNYKSQELRDIRNLAIEYMDKVVFIVNTKIKNEFERVKEENGLSNYELSLLLDLDPSSVVKLMKNKRRPELASVYYWNILAIYENKPILSYLPKEMLTEKDKKILEFY